MEAQDHSKTSPSAHEGNGLHLCHKCGWPFPKPHPSAKHRRAHKKVCGKVEGYQLISSDSGRLSDDEHLSDDDMRTPSPKMDKGNIKEIVSSGGTGLLRSIKSEDEVFSDAVTEFSDSGFSPSMEDSVERVGQLEKNVGKELAQDLIHSQRSKDDGLITVLDDSTRGREEAVGNATTQSENRKTADDITVQEVSVGVDQIDSQPINSSWVASENGDGEKAKELISSEPETNVEVKEGVMELECSPVMPVIEGPELATRPDDLKEKGSEHVVLEYVAPEEDTKTLDALILQPKLHEADVNLLPSTAGGEIVEQEKEPCVTETGNVILEPILHKADESKCSAVGEIEQDKDQTKTLQAEMTEHDVSSEHPKTADGSSTQVGAEIEPDKDQTNMLQADTTEHDVSSEHPKTANGSSTQVGAEIEPDKDQTNMLQADMTELDLSSQIEPSKSANDSDTTQVEVDSTEDVLGHGQSKLTDDYDFKVEGGKERLLVSVSESLPVIENPKIITEDFKDYRVQKSSFPLDLGNVEVTRPVEIGEKAVAEPDPSSISSITISSSDDSSSVNLEKVGVPEPVRKEVDTSALQVISEEGPGTSGLETQDSTNHCHQGFEPSFINEKSSQDEISASQAVELSDVVLVGSSINEVRTNTRKFENAEDNVISRSDYVITESKTSNSFDEVESFTSQKNKAEVNMEATQELELGCNNELSLRGAPGAVSLEDRSVASDKQSENSMETEVQRPISSVDGVSELNPEDKNEASKKNSEDSKYEDPAALPVASVLLIGEADDKHTVENLSVSAVDDSVVSSSRTESLEGNWGSASVLSTQSDGTALTDAEVLSTGAQATEKSEGTRLKPQTTNDANHPDNSDVYEAPSFMTLVDSRTELEKTVEASEINAVQRTEPSKSEAVEAGWIPSLAKVVNESEGRKKNEEIIAKVTNWSSGKQHSPLKSLLNEAQAEVKTTTEKLPFKDHVDETASKNNGAAVTTVSSIMGSETPVHDVAKRELEKEWSSPARYPTEIKKEKKKGKPYWVPFVCCTSIHRDM